MKTRKKERFPKLATMFQTMEPEIRLHGMSLRTAMEELCAFLDDEEPEAGYWLGIILTETTVNETVTEVQEETDEAFRVWEGRNNG